MANKDININIKVNGQEITMTGKQVEVFKKNIVDLKKQLQDLGERTEENGEMFDKLKGDLQSLEQVFGEVKDEAGQATEGVEEFGDETEVAAGKTKSLRAQLTEARNSLAALGERSTQNAAEFDRLTTRVQELSEQYEDVQFGTKKLDDALGALPGPIGQAAQGFKVFDEGLKNARSAMASLTRTFPILKNAIAATGLGALVILFGLLVAAVMKAFNSFKPLQDAVGKLGILFDLLGKFVEPIIELVGTALTIALEALAKAIAFVTGNLDEFNKAIADKKAMEDAAKNLEKQKFDLETLGDTYTEVERQKEEARIKSAEKIAEINASEVLNEQEKADKIAAINARLGRDLIAIDTEEQKKKQEKAQQNAEKAADIEKSFQDKLKSIRNENILLEIQDEAEKNRTKLKMDLDAQMTEIGQLKVSEKKKQELRNETLKNYELKLKEFNDNVIKEETKANEDLAKQVRDIRTSMIEDEKERLQTEAANRRDDNINAIDETIATEEAKAAAKLAINEKYKKDIAKIDEDITKKSGEEVFRQIEFERESRALGLENRLKQIELSTQREIEKAEARRLVFTEQAKLDFDSEISNLTKLLESKQITQKEFDERELQRKTEYELRLTEIDFQNVQSRQQARQLEIDAYVQLGNSVMSLIGLLGKEGEESKALIKIQQGLALATASLTLANNIQALSELAKGFGKQIGQASALPFPASLGAIVAVIGSFAAVLVSAKDLFGIGKGGGKKDASPAPIPNMGRNYEMGGLIGGRRHAQGGTLIEAEAGEAVMTRGAVTMFAPMLSMMNQMGGGTAFGNQLNVRSDAPIVDRPQLAQEPVIMKTYVVSNELTSESEKLARLKDLSTL
jgi:hypothetical protein